VYNPQFTVNSSPRELILKANLTLALTLTSSNELTWG